MTRDYDVGWVRKFTRQYQALCVKHALIAYRNLRATLLQLGAATVFMLLLLMIDEALKAASSRSSRFKNILTPDSTLIGAIPSCQDDLYMSNKASCYDFIYSPDNDAIVDDIIAAMRDNNPGRPIPASSIKGFASLEAANEWMAANPELVMVGVHFVDTPLVLDLSKPVSYGLQVNTTTKFFKGRFQDPNFFARIPLQVSVEREIARQLTTEASDVFDTWEVRVSEFAHPAIKPRSIVGLAGPEFVFAAALFNFVLQIADLVMEKEKGLRQALRTMGMLDSAQWTSWISWQAVICFISTIEIVVLGLIMQFDLFKRNSFGLLFMLIFNFEMGMTGLAILFSVLLRKSQTATNLGFIVFLVGWIIQIVVGFGFPYVPSYYADYNYAYTIVFSLMPWALLAKGINDLGDATATDQLPGLTWKQRGSYCYNYYNVDLSNLEDESLAPLRDLCYRTDRFVNCSCVVPIDDCMWICAILFIGYACLGVWLDNVWPNENGVRKKFYYFLQPSYWRPSADARGKLVELSRRHVQQGDLSVAGRDDDVVEEEKRLRHRLDTLGHDAHHHAVPTLESDRAAVELFSLRRIFPRSLFRRNATCIGDAADREPFVAVKSSWFSVDKGTLFCLLGPNGAGKTTTINMLTGALPPSDGEALVYGEALSAPGGLDRIRSMMGVCPQFDVLWDRMTGREHLLLYGAIKGVSDRGRESDRLLDTVRLTDAGSLRTAGYSGGMKRRLSVAIALLGDPKIVYLDEPTTGLDPISRRYVWDILESVKKSRAIILTTHSMEEADVLGDRIAIMARGELRCIGNATRLKQKFGAGYMLSVSLPQVGGLNRLPSMNMQGLDREAQRASDGIKAFVKARLQLECHEENKAYVSFLIPRQMHDQLPSFLKELEEQCASLNVQDPQLSMTSLEEVFLEIAKNAEVEAARARGGQFKTGYLRDGTPIKVPVGADYVEVPMYGKNRDPQPFAVKWAHDESGELVVSDLIPIKIMPPKEESSYIRL